MRGSSGIVAAVIVAALLGVVAATASAGGHGGGPPEKLTICHVAGLASDPANYVTLHLPPSAVYGNGGHFNENGTPQAGHEQDSFGECDPPEEPYDECENLEGNQPEGTDCYPDDPVDYCDTLPGIQAEDEDCPSPPVDVCENLPGNQPEGTDCNPTTPPVVPPATHDCVFVGADKDGGKDAYGGTNDDCAPAPSPPTVTTTASPPAAAAPPAVAAPPATVTVVSSKPAVKPKPKPVSKPKPKQKAKAAPKPDTPPVAKKVGHVCRTLADGTPRRWYGGGNGVKSGCYAIVKGSG